MKRCFILFVLMFSFSLAYAKDPACVKNLGPGSSLEDFKNCLDEAKKDPDIKEKIDSAVKNFDGSIESLGIKPGAIKCKDVCENGGIVLPPDKEVCDGNNQLFKKAEKPSKDGNCCCILNPLDLGIML